MDVLSKVAEIVEEGGGVWGWWETRKVELIASMTGHRCVTLHLGSDSGRLTSIRPRSFFRSSGLFSLRFV